VASRLIEIVESFQKRTVLLVGDLILDRYIYGDAERISPEAPVPVLTKQYQEERLGGAGSVAASLVTLGLKVVCAGVIGLDDTGHRVRALLDDQGVGTRGVLSLAGRPTTNKTRLVGLAQHRHRQQLLRIDDETVAPLGADDEKRLVSIATRFIPRVDVVCIQDYNKGVVSEELCRRIIETSRAHGKPVLVDPARIPDFRRYRGATALTPNRNEFAIVAGLSDTRLPALCERIDAVADACDCEALLVTLDREGALLRLRGRKPEHVPTQPRSVYDNTGAGDAVLAMLTAAVATGADWIDAARLANVAGGLEVEKFGCAPITIDEVTADLRLSDDAGSGKIRTCEALIPELALRRQRGETILFTNGCFDLLHLGHVRYFQKCRELGKVVVVGLNSDASVRRQGKGDERPICNERERAEMIAALESVDYVVLFDEPTPEPLIRQVRPDILVKGTDWANRGVVGREFVEAHGGKVELIDLVPGYSTTDLINRIREGTSTP
jgi:D-beta-D-heptose 7-phosphate kinase/D-beta-D-heptose 1-phosphate adenosyltransferase